MSYKKRYSRKKYQKKYTPAEDFAIWVAFVIVSIFYGINKIYTENPILFYWGIIALILCAWVILWIIKKKSDRKYMQIKTLQQMKDMDWREFEKFIAFVFQKKWFKAKERKGTNDWWIDVDATKEWQKYVIQCKKWKDYKIWVVEIRSFVGAMEVEWSHVKWIYVTTSRLTIEAQKYFHKMSHKLELWDQSNLEAYVSEYTGVSEENIDHHVIHEKTNPICDKCSWEMIMREAHRWSHKWEHFYGCSNYPKCKNIIKST